MSERDFSVEFNHTILDPNPLISAITVHPFSITALVCLVIICVLLFMSAFVSASEVAFFSLSPQDLDDVDNRRDKRDDKLDKLLNKPEHLLATILIANNFVNVSIVILTSYFISLIFDFSASPILGFLIETVFITFLLLLFGEIMPKIYARQSPLRMSRFATSTLYVLEKIFHPACSLLVHSTSIVNKQIKEHQHSNISMDDIQQALELTSDSIDEDADILKGIASFGNITAAGIMTPRMDVINLNVSNTFKEVIDCIVEHEYSRIPVTQGGFDNIRGVLYAKDLIPHINKEQNFKWQTLIRQPYFVPETKKIDDLLEEFQKNKVHIAIVVDEFGGTSGIVTMEDILEEVVGEISDEYDEDDRQYVKVDDTTYVFEAKIPITDFIKVSDLDVDDFEDYLEDVDTLAGLILEIKGEFPTLHEKIEFNNLIFEIVELDARRIIKIKVNIVTDKNIDNEEQ